MIIKNPIAAKYTVIVSWLMAQDFVMPKAEIEQVKEGLLLTNPVPEHVLAQGLMPRMTAQVPWCQTERKGKNQVLISERKSKAES